MQDHFVDETIGELTDEDRSDYRGQDNQPAQEQRAVPRAKRKRRTKRKRRDGNARTVVDHRRATARRPPDRTPETPDDDVLADETSNVRAASDPDELQLWDRETVLAFFGGSKPIHVSTLYRGVKSGIYPPPMNVSANVVRWIGHECRAARQRMIGERGKTPKPPRGRPRRKII